MRCSLCVILLVLSVSLQAQKLSVTYTNLTTRDGLAGSQVYCAFQDRQGYIWFGTETGVSRYNGRRFENFYTGDGLSDNEVFLMFQDSQDRIWFSTLSGKPSFYLNGKLYNESNTDWLRNISSDSYFNSFYEDSAGNLWFTSYRKGIIRITPQNEVYTYEYKRIIKGQFLSFQEREGAVWVIHSLFGELNLSELKPDSDITDIATTGKVPSQELMRSYMPRQTTFLAAGRHLFDTYLKGIDEEVEEAGLTKIQLYNEEMWLSTYRGAYHLDRDSSVLKRLVFKDKIVTHVLKDREGGYWFTTLGNGVYWSSSIDSKSLTNTDVSMLNGVTSLNWDGEQLLFGSSGAVVGSIREGKVSLHQSDTIIHRAMIKTIEKGDLPGQYILGSDNMLIEVVDGKVLNTQPMNAKVVKRIGQDRWAIGTGNSFSVHTSDQINRFLRMPKKDFKKVTPERHEAGMATFLFPERVWVNDIAPYKDGLLVSTLDGLYQFDKEYNYQPWSHENWEKRRVSDIAVFGNGQDFVLATFGFGIAIFKDGQLTRLTAQDGLSSDLCRKVLIEDDEHLWVATNRGISKLTWSGETWETEIIRKSDGLVDEDVYDLVLTDQLVVATSSGLSMIDFKTLEKGSIKPLVNLLGIEIQNELIQTDSLRRNYSSDEFKISYEGIHYGSGKDLSYRYRVVGVNDQWSVTENTALNMVRLSPGNYRFEVQAISNKGELSDVSTIVLMIAAPFWWTWWFITLCSVVFLSLVVFLTYLIILKNREKAKRKLEMQLRMSENEIKLLKAQMKPHFTYNILNSIQSLILKEDTDKAYEMIGEFASLMRKDLNSYDQNFISLKEELQLLETYLKLEQSRFEEGSWTYEIRLSERVTKEELGVPPMVVQPFAENSLKHAFSSISCKGFLGINIDQEGDWLEIEMKDNGPGLVEGLNGKHKSKGIDIVRKRLKLVDASNSVEVKDNEDKPGVSVMIKLKGERL